MSRRRPAVALLAALLGLRVVPAAAGRTGAGEKRPPRTRPAAGKKTTSRRRHRRLDAKRGLGADRRPHRRSDPLPRRHQHLPIASTTKLMTACVALKDMPLDKIVSAQPY